MAVSIDDKKRKIKETRSRAIQQKINLLWARDGNEHPLIESSAEDDDFNLNQLFGGSKSAIIDWTQLGVEGLIRCYYEIIYNINGKKRNNIITNNGETPNGGAFTPKYNRSDLTTTARQILVGTAYKSGYFVGNEDGFEGRSRSSDTINAAAAKGTYDLNSTTFSTNIDQEVPENDSGKLIDQFNSAISLIGINSPLGPHISSTTPTTETPNPPAPQANNYIYNTILGKRFCDVYPSNINYGYGEGSSTTYTFGNGVYDTNNISLRDYYNPGLDSNLTTIVNLLNLIRQYIVYSKVSYDNFFMNTTIIPGRDNNWALQGGWLSTIDTVLSQINHFISLKPMATRLELDQLIIDLKTNLLSAISPINAIVPAVDALFGTPLSPNTLYGFRLLWIKNLIDVQNGGSKITLLSVAGSIEDADKKISQAEEGYGIIGVQLKNEPSFSSQRYWDGGIVDPIIGGIETHLALDTRQFLDTAQTIENENYFQMVPDGLIIAWQQTAHATAYNLYKSNNYDPTTEQGTWTALIPTGQTYTNENIDLNTGKVLSYFIDYNVSFEAEESPYYKVKVIDTGKMSANNYWWYGSTSGFSKPMSASDFLSSPSSGTNVPGMSGSPSTRPDELPDYLFKYATMKMGGEAADSPVNKIYKSDVEFDSIGSNLEVFIDGELRNQGSGNNDYRLLNLVDIEFKTPIDSNSKVTMIVYYGSSSGSGSGSWKAPVATLDQRPTIGNVNGDIILVIENNTIYSWSGTENNWFKVSSAGSDLVHTDLLDMPDSSGMNSDHDQRYPRRDEVDSLISDLQYKLNNLSYLIPDNAIPLTSHLEITNTDYYTGYLSSGTNAFNTLQANQLFNKIVIGDLFIIESTNKDAEFADADKGVLSIYLNDVLIDSINLETNFIEDDRGLVQSWTPFSSSIIEITSIYPFNNFGQYQKCNFKLNIPKTRLTPGENKIVLKHESSLFSRKTPDFIFFWDSSPSTIFFSDYTLTEKLLTSQKYLSGLRYYYLGDKLEIKFRAQGLFDNTYVNGDQVKTDMTELGIQLFDFDYTDSHTTVDGQNNPSLMSTMPMWYTNTISLNQAGIYSTSPTIKLIGKKPYITSDVFTKTFNNVLINTWAKQSDDKNEYFVDEKYRLPYDTFNSIPGSFVDRWDSRKLLTPGNLMLYGGKLYYPAYSFVVGFKPAQTANYGAFTGNCEYYRAFIDASSPHNNGVFNIKGNIFDDSRVKIMMKLPGQTNWLDLKVAYNEATFSGSEGDGCLLEYSENNFSWTSGGFSTAISGYMIILRVIMVDAGAAPIEEISIKW